MHIIRGSIHSHFLTHYFLKNSPFLKGSAVTIGNFDGVHLGHQALLQRLKTKAQQLQLPSVIITFKLTPSTIKYTAKGTIQLSSLRTKINLMREQGLEYVYILPFNCKLMNQSAQEFVQQILIKILNTRYLLIGKDFHFGKDRLGNSQLLNHFVQQKKFAVDIFEPIFKEDNRISSTLIRHYLHEDEINKANALLGYPYFIHGKVVQGQQKGRQLGFPTANIEFEHYAPPLAGVYVVKIKNAHQHIFFGIANVGNRPTLNISIKKLLEVHIFNFNQYIYGHWLDIVFLHKIRPEKRFESLLALQQQISDDQAQAKRYLYEKGLIK